MPSVTPNSQASADTQPTFSVTISTPVSLMKSGSEVELDIATKNISGRDVYHHVTTLGSTLKITARDSKGNPVPMTPYGLKIHGMDPKNPPVIISVASFRMPLKPGEVFNEKIALSKEYDLSKPDKYTVQVLRDDVLSESDKKLGRGPAVNSNMITLTVIP